MCVPFLVMPPDPDIMKNPEEQSVVKHQVLMRLVQQQSSYRRLLVAADVSCKFLEGLCYSCLVSTPRIVYNNYVSLSFMEIKKVLVRK